MFHGLASAARSGETTLVLPVSGNEMNANIGVLLGKRTTDLETTLPVEGRCNLRVAAHPETFGTILSNSTVFLSRSPRFGKQVGFANV